MKHPLWQQREKTEAFRQRCNRYWAKYCGSSYAILLLCVMLPCMLAWPAVSVIPALIICCAGFAVCNAIALHLAKRRSLEELRAEGVIESDWLPPRNFPFD